MDAHAELFRQHNYGGLNDAIEAADLILINGEGAVMQKRAPARRMFFLLHYNARYFGKPAALINHTADLTDLDLREFAALAYRHADAIRVREPISLATVQGLDTGRDVKLAADAAFAWRPTGPATAEGLVNAEAFDPTGPYICIGGTAHWRLEPFADRDRAGLLTLIEQVGQRMQVVLVAAGTPEDEIFADLAVRQGLPLAPPDYPTQAAMNLMAGADAYVGGRWHTAISALNAGTPTVLFASNSANKNTGLIQMFEGTGVAMPVAATGLTESLPAILAELDRVLAAGKSLSSRLSERADMLRPTVASNLDLLQSRKV